MYILHKSYFYVWKGYKATVAITKTLIFMITNHLSPIGLNNSFDLHIFSFPQTPRPAVRSIHLASYTVGTGLLFEGKVAGCEVDHPPPSNTDVKNE